MKRAFGDTHYFLALLNPRDQDHERATEFGEQWTGKIITTRWVLITTKEMQSVSDHSLSGLRR